MTDFSVYDDWVMGVHAAGSTEILREVDSEDQGFPSTILYAVKGKGWGTRLVGSWSEKNGEGKVYSGNGMSFERRKRNLQKAF